MINSLFNQQKRIGLQTTLKKKIRINKAKIKRKKRSRLTFMLSKSLKLFKHKVLRQVQIVMMTQFLERKRRKMFKLELKNKKEVAIVKRTKSKRTKM